MDVVFLMVMPKCLLKIFVYTPQMCAAPNFAEGSGDYRDTLPPKVLRMCHCGCSAVEGTSVSTLIPSRGEGNIAEEGAKKDARAREWGRVLQKVVLWA